MHLIAIRNLRSDASKYPDTLTVIEEWYKVVKSMSWQNLGEVNKYFLTHADYDKDSWKNDDYF
jgi:mRNA interferase HigB